MFTLRSKFELTFAGAEGKIKPIQFDYEQVVTYELKVA